MFIYTYNIWNLEFIYHSVPSIWPVHGTFCRLYYISDYKLERTRRYSQPRCIGIVTFPLPKEREPCSEMGMGEGLSAKMWCRVAGNRADRGPGRILACLGRHTEGPHVSLVVLTSSRGRTVCDDSPLPTNQATSVDART